MKRKFHRNEVRMKERKKKKISQKGSTDERKKGKENLIESKCRRKKARRRHFDRSKVRMKERKEKKI